MAALPSSWKEKSCTASHAACTHCCCWWGRAEGGREPNPRRCPVVLTVPPACWLQVTSPTASCSSFCRTAVLAPPVLQAWRTGQFTVGRMSSVRVLGAGCGIRLAHWQCCRRCGLYDETQPLAAPGDSSTSNTYQPVIVARILYRLPGLLAEDRQQCSCWLWAYLTGCC